jgi:hypothetical protein
LAEYRIQPRASSFASKAQTQHFSAPPILFRPEAKQARQNIQQAHRASYGAETSTRWRRIRLRMKSRGSLCDSLSQQS